MSYYLQANSLRYAIKHICRYGDTDVFPHLSEISFIREREDLVVKELAQLDIESFEPGSAAEAIGPKSRYGFRIVHQLPLIETILFLAAVVEIGDQIESARLPVDGIEVASYRFKPDEKGGLFRSDRTYKDWLSLQQNFLQNNLKIKSVIATDISDFYARVNFHRLENLLDEVAPQHGASQFIKKCIKTIRARQSFGLPVGGSAARLLAELALSDTDKALKNEQHLTTRFVDDFRVFLRADNDAYDVLAFIAEQLAINEGLSLNVSKTSVYSRADYLSSLKRLLADVSEEAEGAALDALVATVYFGNDPDPKDIEKLKSLNLLGFLQEEVGKDVFDVGRIKVIFRALKITKPKEAIEYIENNFGELVVFAKEITLLMHALKGEYPFAFNDLSDSVIDCILSPPASSIQLIKTWLLELFVRGIVPIDSTGVKKLDALTSSLDRRQLHLIRGRMGDKNYFRKGKTAFGQLAPAERPYFIWGASCLPKDEYKNWLKTIAPMFKQPLGGLFLKWAETRQMELINLLEAPLDDHHE